MVHTLSWLYWAQIHQRGASGFVLCKSGPRRKLDWAFFFSFFLNFQTFPWNIKWRHQTTEDVDIFRPLSIFFLPRLLILILYVCVLCSWNQTQLSTFGKETSSNTRMRWQMLHHQGTRPCCPLPGTWTVSPTARTGTAITRPTHRISRVCLHGWFTLQDLFISYCDQLLAICMFSVFAYWC